MNRYGCAEEDVDFDAFEAVCGVTGDHPCCGAEAPIEAYTVEGAKQALKVEAAGCCVDTPCTRQPGHAGHHVAAHTNGRVLARWLKETVH